MTRIRFAAVAAAVLVFSMWAWPHGEARQAPAGQSGVAVGAQQGARQGGRGGRDGRARTRKVVLAWADTRNGIAQHDSTSHALSVIEQLGYESGAYDTYIRTDSNIISTQPLMTTGARASGGPSLASADAIFFLGHREVALDESQKTELAAFVREGKGFVAAHVGLTAFESWPEFGELLGGRYDDHPWGTASGTRPRDISRQRFRSWTSSIKRRARHATRSVCSCVSTSRRWLLTRSCGIGTTRWRGRRCTARGGCSTRRSDTHRRHGTTATSVRCTSRRSSGRSE